ncbi:MAG: DUF937 domain-containing protein [Chlorobium limicola]|uniref:OmpA family protein n=1 Tax=Chlorobium limicola TaxID=1092 RepID=UPI0023F1E2EB|nr:OmpA family protein [Chlorobium limicola]NTV08907.1 DUF937 domain-containing protein [Chlorobium limicola]NTV21134.1 DUF937 domain-containing protein [Chlorobium limicola]
MALNLLELVTAGISRENTGKMAALLGEETATVTGSLGAVAASILSGLMNKASATGGAQEIVSRIAAGEFKGDLLNNFGSLLAGGRQTETLLKTGGELVSFLFGSKSADLGKVIASSTGLAKGSSSSLLGMMAPFVMAVLGKQVTSDNLDSEGLTSLLNSQKSAVQRAAPAGLPGVLGLLSLSQLGGAPPTVPIGIPGNIASFAKGLWPFLLGIAALALLMKTCGQPPVKETPPPAAAVAPDTTAAASDTSTAAPDSAAVAADSLGAFGEYELPNGVKLNIPEFGIERKLIAFIEDATKPADKETWFSFDRLVFDTGKATLKPESQEQIGNINEILKAFSAVSLKFGGYTDNVGDPQANLRLSKDRAEAVMTEIVKLGIDKARLDAEGYGAEHPVADNATEEGRQKNRRVDCRVTKK